ncbi:MAG TPA: FHA domain-containing protein [Verrucomicrobiae bacterium]
MIQLNILSGSMAGETIFVRHFPFHIGRSEANHLQLVDEGIWDDHLTITWQVPEGLHLAAQGDAFVAVNENQQREVTLRNGDIISLGSAKVQFWLAPARLRGLRVRELSFWLFLAGITLAQIWMLLKLRQ